MPLSLTFVLIEATTAADGLLPAPASINLAGLYLSRAMIFRFSGLTGEGLGRRINPC